MGDELRAVARLASARDRTLSGLDAGEPGTAHGSLHDGAKLVESSTLRVLGRVVGAEPVRATHLARAERRLRRHIAPGVRVAAVADRRPTGPGARAGRSVRSHARLSAVGESAGVRSALRRAAGRRRRRGRRARQRARADGDGALLVHRPTRLADAAAVAASYPAPPLHYPAVARRKNRLQVKRYADRALIHVRGYRLVTLSCARSALYRHCRHSLAP